MVGQSTRGTGLRAHLVPAASSGAPARHWPDEVTSIIDPHPGRRSEQAWAPYRIHGGPGTGKTSLLVDAAVARLAAPDIDPESVLVIAANRRAAVRLREEITRRVLSTEHGFGSAVREPLVRTVHSYAFAILRLQASAHGNPPPRLITGSEQDMVLRELLAGDVEDGAGYWPEHLRPALTTDGFAQALRDLIMRAAERGVGPEDLIELGREHKRPEWSAAGRAYAQYEQNMLLRGAVGLATPGASAPAVDAAELIGSALSALATDPHLLVEQRGRIRHLLVDDAQHLDPQAAALVRLIGTGTDSTIVAADTDQSVFGFRGADPSFADGLAPAGDVRDIELRTDFRSHPEVNRVGRVLTSTLPGSRPHRYPEPVGVDVGRPPGGAGQGVAGGAGQGVAGGAGQGATVRVFGSYAKEATAVADLLRRAHLLDGVPWSQMAVIVRSVPSALPALRRAFRSAGVPMTTPTSDLPLHRQRSVIALMLVLRAVAAREGGVDAHTAFGIEETSELLTGLIGGADAGAMRRLRRGVRRFDEKHEADEKHETAGSPVPDSLTSLRLAILDPAVAQRYLKGLGDTEVLPLTRVLAVVDAADRAHRGGRGIEETLWVAWQATGHERRWAASALRGGPIGEQADRDLDAVIAMFEAAAGFVDNLPAAGPMAFVHYLSQLQIPRDTRAPSAAAESVTVLSAHAATGREWEVVAVAGVLEGLWPSLRSRGSVLGTGQLVDLLDGMAPDAIDTVARGTMALADERRLLLVACTRARRRLLLSAVDDGGSEASPSRFIAEIARALGPDGAEADPTQVSEELPVDPGVGRVLSLGSMVATLRAELTAALDLSHNTAEDGETAVWAARRAREVAELLAELADVSVAGAHPRDWYGLGGPSTDRPLWSESDGPRQLSPSAIESVTNCSLRWLLEKHGGQDGDQSPAVTGTLIHTLAQAVEGELDPRELTEALRRVWDRVDTGAEWFSARELARAERMLTDFREWVRISRADLTVHGVEVDVDATLPAVPDPDDPEAPEQAVRLRGRIDRLETDAKGRPVVVDVKTGKTPISAEAAREHAQLAAYQVALSQGGVADFGPAEPGGGRLVYVASSHTKAGAAQREQPAPTLEQLDEWIAMVRKAARKTVGPVYPASPNPGCGHCSLKTSCPAQLQGKSVLDD